MCNETPYLLYFIAYTFPRMKIGDLVILNEQGIESWENNRGKQWVPQTTVWMIVGGGSFDQYGRIVKLRALHDDGHRHTNNESIDEYDCYYEHCLQVVELPDTKKTTTDVVCVIVKAVGLVWWMVLIFAVLFMECWRCVR